jgi:hypothetical protein
MYLVPDNQRNHYLKEISILARALQNNNNLDTIRNAADLNAVRNYLLDLVNYSKSIVGIRYQGKNDSAGGPGNRN